MRGSNLTHSNNNAGAEAGRSTGTEHKLADLLKCKAVSDAIINVSHLRVNNTKENFREGKTANAIHEWENK
ncbi:hypothetical protein DPMN_031222 [Dreissena polymorpha]|uniref:Uncharacterized protein n=1 Tax=Dreissena polymorpha TaxID=45954 RepID=A0A9D4LZK5_DREPO|nr:hypothetical protein DPMN_031222 [Dreissena polymorpha]